MQLMPDSSLRQVAIEIESHAAQEGWDQNPKLYALVATGELLTHEPALAESMGIDGESATDSYTPIEQEDVPDDRTFEETLGDIMWPEAVAGCAAVMERIMLPPEAEENLPDDPDDLEAFVADHPERRDVRLVAAVTRAGDKHSLVRARSPEDAELLEGPDLVPGLVARLQQTLAD